MKVYALLTGRGNNTLKDKNVLDCLGHPVLYYPANSASHAKTIDKKYCSSDDPKILTEAEKLGHKAIVRPAELALPTSQHVDCILHGLKIIEKDAGMPDILVVTLANNVTIKSEWIDECVKMMQQDMTISAVVPVYQDNDHHPLRAKTVDENGRLQMYEKGIKEKISTNRQDLPVCYFLAHNFWVLNVKNLLESKAEGQQPWGFMGNNIAYYEIDHSIDIHENIDLYIAQEWIKENYTDFD
ncbi:MAG: CMP-N-acetylneuraminic acid synthetase [Clostridia bacterium]|nr:CMP-N-acetylneuraminic acid synthetase [Clostridia bacterium]